MAWDWHIYSSWLGSDWPEQDEEDDDDVEDEDAPSASRVLSFSCSESCSPEGMEFFFGRPFGLVGDSSPPPCNTLKIKSK